MLGSFTVSTILSGALIHRVILNLDLDDHQQDTQTPDAVQSTS